MANDEQNTQTNSELDKHELSSFENSGNGSKMTDAQGSSESSDESKKKKKGKKEKEKIEQVGYFKLFSYADKLDVLLMILGTIGAAGFGAIMPIFSLLFGDLINALNKPPDQMYDEVVKVAIYFLYAGAGAFVGAYLAKACWMTSAERQAERIRDQYLLAILRQDMAFFDQTGTGELTTRISSDTIVIQEAIGEKVGTLVQFLSTFVAGFIIGFIQGWKLTLVVLSVCPLLVISGALMMWAIGAATNQGLAAYAKAGNIATEVISSIRTVSSFNGEPTAFDRYTSNLDDARKMGMKKGLFTGLGMGAVNFFFYAVFALALWYGGKLVVDDGYSAGDVTTVLFSVVFGAFALGQTSPSVEAMSKGRGAGFKLFQTIQRNPAIDSFSVEGKKPTEVLGDIELKDISFRYPTRPDAPIFSHMNLKIPAGKTVALVGPSGSGKSSIVGLCQRFYDPEDGSVMLDGCDIKELNVRWLREQIGLVSQEPTLFSGTIADNISFSRKGATQEEIEEAARSANAHNFIMSFPDGYQTQVGEKGAQLSGGQKQRIAIARAIIKNPKILLLDEATSALDTESEKVVQDALDKVMKGRTVIVVAHRLATVRDADIIAVIHQGSVAELGTHGDLMELNGIYAELVKLQTGPAGALMLDKNSTKTKKTFDVTSSMTADADNKDSKKDVIAEPTEEELKKVSIVRIAKLNKSEWPYFIGGTMGAIVTGGVNPAFAIIFTKVLQVYYRPVDRVEDGVRPWALGFLGMAVAIMIATVAQMFFFTAAGEHLTQRLRQMSFRSIIRHHVGWFDLPSHSTGVLTSRLASEATLVEGLLGTRLGLIVQNAVTIIAGLVIGFIYSWKLTLVLLATSPLLAFAQGMEFVALTGFSQKTQKATQNANQLATEAISNIRTVAAYTNERNVYNEYLNRLVYPRKVGIRSGNLSGFLVGLSQFLLYASYTLTFWYGAKLMRDDGQDFLDIMTAFFAIFMISMSVGQTTALAPNATKAKTAAAAVFSLIDDQPTIDAFSTEGKQEKIKGEIVFENVEFTYPSRPDSKILRGLNLVAPAGKMTALVGASGCGKSSCIGLIERWYDPQSGSIKMDGIDIRDINIRSLRDQVGLVGQEPVLFVGTIAENIAYGKPGATMEEIEAAGKSANAHNFIMSFPDGYQTQVGERGGKLSGGQKQRIAIARAIIKNPQVLLLDEATSALDTESEKVVQQALDSIIHERIMTTIVIAHRLSTIKKADSIAVIHNGKVLEQGTHEELLQLEGLYFNLVSRQT